MKQKTLNEFQIEEYKNISNAHFETNKQIGIFFRYFLIIASAPAVIFIWFGKNNDFLYDLLIGKEKLTNLFVGFFLLIVAVIGILSSFYLISLKLDSILYARTVNGVRKYFYQCKIKFEEHFRVLPKQTNQPKYRETHTFGIIVVTLALINSLYLAVGTRIIASVGDYFFNEILGTGILFNNYNIRDTIFLFLVLIFFHLGYYFYISLYRKNSYLKSSIIGIDIDGVLNQHLKTFCKFYTRVLKDEYISQNNIPIKKSLTPEEITTIPVHHIRDKNISEKAANEVFNNPEYWTQQTSIDEEASKIIRKLKNRLGYKIYIHSYRPWPEYSNTVSDKKSIEKLWSNSDNLSKLTKNWLGERGIVSDKLFIEKSSADFSSRSFSLFGIIYGIQKASFRNRFYKTAKKPYRYFVEDDPENAIKLANTCEYVFLIKQPYNTKKNLKQKLPQNVIRVKDWLEIEMWIKKLG